MNAKKAKQTKKSERGITLVALVITVIILIILSTITLNAVLGEHGLINKAMLAKNMILNSVIKEQEEINELSEEMSKETIITIDSNVTTYNQTLGEFTIIYRVIGKLGEETIYENLINVTVNKAESNLDTINANLPDGVVLTIQPVYYSPNYDLISNSTVTVDIAKDNLSIVSFNYEYNGKIIGTGSNN